jgi:predicted RNA-binding Zn-ribbon protein involved in translation (DUF1610 family)
MIIISNYEKKFDSETQFSLIISKENVPCPYCGGELLCRDHVTRGVIHADGTVETLLIRRMFCPDCGHLHRELPDFVQPFKHYASGVIETVLDGNNSVCSAENSTLSRWKVWFLRVLPCLCAALTAVQAYVSDSSVKLMCDLSPVADIRSKGFGWLRGIMRRHINFVGTLSGII